MGINWNFENDLVLFISSDSGYKKILLESLTIPLNSYDKSHNFTGLKDFLCLY